MTSLFQPLLRGFFASALVLAASIAALAQDPATEAAAPAAAKVRRLEPLVSVMGDAVVQRNERAESVVVVRGDATIEGDVDSDVVVVFGNLKLRGKVKGDVVVVLGSADIDGEVDGDLGLILSRGKLGPKTDVRGSTAAIGQRPDIDVDAKLAEPAEIVPLGPLVAYLDSAKEYLFQGVLLLRPFPPRLGWVWIVAGVFLVFHLLVTLVFARPVEACTTTLRTQPASSFLVGLLVCVLVGPVSVILSFTIVAVPLVWLAFTALCLFGRIAVYGAAGAAVGSRAGGGTLHPVAAVLLGSILFYLSYMIPVIGYLTYWLVLPFGVGATLLCTLESLRGERRRDAATPLGHVPPGSLAAASALASGTPGPATHAIEIGPEPGLRASAGPGLETEPPPMGSEPPRATPPPVVPLSAFDVLTFPRAGFWQRFAATLVDLMVIAFVNGMSFGHVRSFWILLAVYHLAMWTWKGTTLGGSVLGLRLVRLDGRPLDWQTAVYRLLGCVVSILPLGLGFLWVAWDPETQSWHDRIAGTTIVKANRRSALA